MSSLFLINIIFFSTSILCTSVIIKTDYGLIEGSQTQSINAFVAIPYAKPPINKLRFEPPQHIEPWTGTFMANGGSIPECPQSGYSPLMSEDCLVLNVYTPLDAKESITMYPVLIWIHGGAFLRGYSGFHDMSSIIKYIGDIIIVSINYRLGILGSLYDNTFDTGLEGNYGYLDQKMAMEWVYNNIKYFGGDPTQIILFGPSSGAQSVGLHLLYNNDLISGGIMQSPPFGMPLRDPITWYNVPDAFTTLIECDEYIDTDNATELLHCWRSASWQSIVDLQSLSFANFDLFENWNVIMPFTPTVKTNVLPNQPIFEWQNGNITDKIPPFIIGHNRDEGFGWISLSESWLNYDMLYTMLEMFYGDSNVVDTIFDYYGITKDSENIDSDLSTFYGDFAFDCAIRNITQNSMNNNVYYYHFNVIDDRRYSSCYNRSCHGEESEYLFADDSVVDNKISIGNILKIYWTNFAKYLNPNDNDIGNNWETFCKNMKIMTITIDNYTAIDDEHNSKCDFWDHIGYGGVYCTDCVYVPTDPSTSNSPIQQCVDIIETTDVTFIDTSFMDRNNTANMRSLRISIIIIVCAVIVVIILELIFCIKKREKDRNKKQMGESLEMKNVKHAIIQEDNDHDEIIEPVDETLIQEN